MYAAGRKAGGTALSKPFDTGHGVIGFGICPEGFQFYFGSVFFTMPPPDTHFWNSNVYSVPLDVGSI